MATSASPTDESHQKNSLENNSFETENGELCDNNLNKSNWQNERSVFYKKRIKKENNKLEIEFNETPQEIRRQRILHYQKQNREALLNAKRGLLENAFDSENEEEMEEVADDEEQEEMEVCPIKRKFKPRKEYARMLMFSEWMLEVPQDFADNWVMVPCPVGKRVLIVACKGLTKMYSRRGIQLTSFKSLLPGGSSATFRNHCTILDCIWTKDKETVYVLDVIVWSNQEMLNCDTEFRFYWLRTQLNDINSIKDQKEDTNDFSIVALPTVNCNQDFTECLQDVAETLTIDGLLFYHKEAHYTSGRTPLVTWLKPYMLPEVLGISVPEEYIEKPPSYINFEHHVLSIIQNEKRKLEHRQKNTRQSQVDVEEME
ncbi:snurportin-1 [Copidosoma floridanum]|uniref:snurportin-1 n=1 Tax=Copidosoma floridanum TaxID=29053 RepID=UPI0006C93EBC|nr:snurportin-1 [Copidosoma floridanum]